VKLHEKLKQKFIEKMPLRKVVSGVHKKTIHHGFDEYNVIDLLAVFSCLCFLEIFCRTNAETVIRTRTNCDQ